jgi:hypothetical protein
MFIMSWRITVGNYQLGMLDKVEITKSVELLSDTAEITLPATVLNQPFDINDKIKRGDAVKIELGYDGNLVTEFAGYLSEEPHTDNGNLTLKCEDNIFLYRKAIPNTVLNNANVTTILNYVNKHIGGFTVNCDYDFSYDKFVINNSTGYDVLKKIQEEAKPNIYLKENVLHVHPPYAYIFGEANYDFSVNIETADLKYRRAEERPVLVIVKGKNAAGKTIEQQIGTSGGDIVNFNKISGVSDTQSLLNAAKSILATESYSGYEGSFTGWLLPYCDAGYKVHIVDNDYEYKTGNYYVLEVKTTFSREGGKREIKLGKKLSDG